MTTPKLPHTLETELAVLNTKLDGIQTTLNVRLTHMDDRIGGLAKLLDAKTDKSQTEDRFVSANARIEKIEGHINKLVWLIVGAVVIAVVGMVLIKPGQSSNPQAQLTVPAVIQQHVPAPVQNHPPEASK